MPGASAPPPAATSPGRRVETPDASWTIPPTTTTYDAGQVDAVAAGPGGTSFTVPQDRAPLLGGHVAIAAGGALRDGLLGKVVGLAPGPVGRVTVTVQRAPLAAVFDDVQIDVDRAVEPVLVDRDGGRVTLGPTLAREERTTTTGMWDCGESGDAANLWSTGNGLPLELELQRVKILHRFDGGNALLGREPFLLLQLSGEAVAKLQLTAKAGFRCELSRAFRNRFRLELPIAFVQGVRITAYFEPSLGAEVSARGSVGLTRRQYFAFTFRNAGWTTDPRFTRAHSADPAQPTSDARLGVRAWAAGDLSLMVGTGFDDLRVDAGLYGQLGPEFEASTSADDPGCMSAVGRMKAEFGVRLTVWHESWDFRTAELSWPDQPIGRPWCVFDEPPVNPPVAPPTAFSHASPLREDANGREPSWAYPAGDGRWLVVDRLADTRWQYQLLDRDGTALGEGWQTADDPASVVSAQDGTVFVLGHDRRDDDARTLTRVSPGNTDRLVVEQEPPPSSTAQPGHLAVDAEQALYWAKPSTATPGILRLNPVTLQPAAFRGTGLSTPELVPGPLGSLHLLEGGFSLRTLPTALFETGTSAPLPDIQAVTPEPAGQDALPAVGADGTFASVSTWPPDCEQRLTVAHADGRRWSRDLVALLDVDERAGCTVRDVDVLPDGGVLLTLSGAGGVRALVVDRFGDRVSLTRLGDGGHDLSTTVDGAGTAFTVWTETVTCSGDAPDEPRRCSEVAVRGLQDGTVSFTETLQDGSGQMMVYAPGGGRPSVAPGAAQVAVLTQRGEQLTPGVTFVPAPSTPRAGRNSFSTTGG